MKTSLCIIILCLGSLNGVGQEWRLVRSIDMDQAITAQSIDPDGRVYVGTSSGNLYRFESDGSESEYFSEIANLPITMISAWNRFKVFTFFNSSQEFYFLDRFNTTPGKYSISDYQRELATLCTPGMDNSIWILSSQYSELRKFHEQSKKLILANPIQINFEKASHLRAFQNLILISDTAEGIFFFDQYGNLQAQLKEPGIRHFQIIDGQLIFLSGGHIWQTDVFDQNRVIKTKAPDGSFLSVLKSGSNYFFFDQHQIRIYTWDL